MKPADDPSLVDDLDQDPEEPEMDDRDQEIADLLADEDDGSGFEPPDDIGVTSTCDEVFEANEPFCDPDGPDNFDEQPLADLVDRDRERHQPEILFDAGDEDRSLKEDPRSSFTDIYALTKEAWRDWALPYEVRAYDCERLDEEIERWLDSGGFREALDKAMEKVYELDADEFECGMPDWERTFPTEHSIFRRKREYVLALKQVRREARDPRWRVSEAGIERADFDPTIWQPDDDAALGPELTDRLVKTKSEKTKSGQTARMKRAKRQTFMLGWEDRGLSSSRMARTRAQIDDHEDDPADVGLDDDGNPLVPRGYARLAHVGRIIPDEEREKRADLIAEMRADATHLRQKSIERLADSGLPLFDEIPSADDIIEERQEADLSHGIVFESTDEGHWLVGPVQVPEVDGIGPPAAFVGPPAPGFPPLVPVKHRSAMRLVRRMLEAHPYPVELTKSEQVQMIDLVKKMTQEPNPAEPGEVVQAEMVRAIFRMLSPRLDREERWLHGLARLPDHYYLVGGPRDPRRIR